MAAEHPASIDAALLGRLHAVDLPTLEAAAALQHRLDTKYVVPEATIGDLVGSLDDGWRILEIDGARAFAYRSMYLDDHTRTSYVDHIKGRRRRFKVRIRQYGTDTADMLEVKLKTGRGLTDKHRTARPNPASSTLTADEQRWVDDVLVDTAPPGTAARLAPSITIHYSRVTLWHVPSDERMTIDLGTRASLDDRSVVLVAGGAIVEVKSSAVRGVATDMLLKRNHRPATFSKYCVGLASLQPHLDGRMAAEARRQVRRQVSPTR